MSGSNPIQCAICGWTGHASDLDDGDTDPSCPVCGESLSPDS